jgi:putative lipoic acid-binding regulatory protein
MTASGPPPGQSEPSGQSDEARALELLRATHQFPVEYHLSVITRYDEAVFVSLRVAVEAGTPLPEDAYQRIPSSGGKYASHRFRVPVDSAEAVLALYARVKAVQGVMSIL